MKKATRFYASVCTATAAAVLCGLGTNVSLSASAAAPSSMSRVGNFIIKNVLENAYTTIKDAQPGEPGSIVTGVPVSSQSVIDFSDLHNTDNYTTFDIVESDNYYYKLLVPNVNDTDGDTVYGGMIKEGESSSPAYSSAPVVTASAAPALSGGTVVPASLTQGYGVIVRGTIKSDSKLTAVTVAVYDANNKRVTGKTVYPAAYSYDLNRMDEYILFNELTPGTYTYQVIAANADSNNHVLTSQTFTVKASSGNTSAGSGTCTASTARLTGGTDVPSSIAKGQGVSVKGTVNSDSAITALTVGIYNSYGTAVSEKSVYPYTFSYDLRNLDSFIAFSQLKSGTYTYQVTASNEDRSNQVLTKQSFTVKSASQTEPECSGESAVLSGGTVVPSSLVQGYGVIVRGTVKSPDSKLTALTVAVYDENNKRVTGKTVYPNAYSYDLNRLDDYVLFSDLKPGTYSYQVIAANADDNNHVLTNQSFAVKTSSGSTNTEEPEANGESVTLTGGTVVPSSLVQGYGVIVRGTVKSPDSKLTALTVAVYDENNQRVTGKTVYPNAYSYDLNRLDDYVLFSDLKSGTYSYQVIAANADDNNHVLTNQSFAVKASSSGSTGTEEPETNGESVTLTGGTVVPSQIAEGDGVIVRGTVKSPYSRISALLVAIYDENNALVTGKRVYPDAYSYNLGKLDNYVLFSQLKPGTYSYQVVAANSDNNNHVLTNQTFAVKGASSAGNTETGTGTGTGSQPETNGQSVILTGGTSVPTSIRQGEGVSVLGTVKSSSMLTALTVAVYDENNIRVTGKTVYPGGYSYKLSQLDDSVRFSDLKPGTYTYQVIAANADNNNHVLTKQSFTVKSESSSSSSSSSGSASDTQSAVLVRGTAVPSQITAGEGVTVRGTVESTSNLTALTVGIYDADGVLVTGKTVYPGTRLYNLGLLDVAVRFSDLTAGTYSYQVIAANADSENIVLTNQSFRVTE